MEELNPAAFSARRARRRMGVAEWQNAGAMHLRDMQARIYVSWVRASTFRHIMVSGMISKACVVVDIHCWITIVQREPAWFEICNLGRELWVRRSPV